MGSGRELTVHLYLVIADPHKVGVCLVTDHPDTSVESLRAALRSVMANYKLPRRLKLYDEIPRNVSDVPVLIETDSRFL
jgi:acyl-CoA synthetase (AMP-forming)/AMP-acid ligase II